MTSRQMQIAILKNDRAEVAAKLASGTLTARQTKEAIYQMAQLNKVLIETLNATPAEMMAV